MSDNKALFKYAIQLGDQITMSMLRKKSYVKLANLTCEYFYSQEPVPFSERKNHSYSPLRVGDKWSKDLYGCAWMHFTGKVPQKTKGKHVVLLIDVGGEGCAYTKDGKPFAGITDIAPIEKNFHILRGKKIIEISSCAEGGEEIDLWLDAGDNAEKRTKDVGVLRQADICLARDDIAELFYDVQNLALTKPYHPFFTKKHQTMNGSLLKAAPGVLFSSAKNVDKARKAIAAERKNGVPSPYTVYAVGHGHLDLAFMWPIRETKRKEIRTFINQLNNIKEFDGYVYGAPKRS